VRTHQQSGLGTSVNSHTQSGYQQVA